MSSEAPFRSFSEFSEPETAETAPSAMQLPPELSYDSEAELFESIQSWAALNVYWFVKKRSAKINKSDRSRITFACDRYGPPPPKSRNLSPKPTEKPLHIAESATTTLLYMVYNILITNGRLGTAQMP